MASVTGGCLCGAVRYRSAHAPFVARVCWCRDCQYFGAGGGTVNVGFPTEGFVVEGELSIFENVAASGNRMLRRFCPRCGTPMFSEALARPHQIFARAGTLDDPELMAPAMTIWTSSAPRWACIAEDVPKIEGQPPPVT